MAMLILSTLAIAWIARNWWKILLLILGLIILHEYRLRKQKAEAAAGDNKPLGISGPASETPPDSEDYDPRTYIPPPFGRK